MGFEAQVRPQSYRLDSTTLAHRRLAGYPQRRAGFESGPLRKLFYGDAERLAIRGDGLGCSGFAESLYDGILSTAAAACYPRSSRRTVSRSKQGVSSCRTIIATCSFVRSCGPWPGSVIFTPARTYCRSCDGRPDSPLSDAWGKRFTRDQRMQIIHGADEIDLVNSGLEGTMIQAYRQFHQTRKGNDRIHDLRRPRS